MNGSGSRSRTGSAWASGCTEKVIYHIAIRAEWESQAGAAAYAPARYEKDGFIHCSEQFQLGPVADYNFRGRDDLVLLELMPTKLEPETRYEQGGKEKYPHIYGPINKDAVSRVMDIQCNADGLFGGVFDDLSSSDSNVA